MNFSILQAFKLSSLQALNPSSLKSSGKESSRIPRATAPSPPQRTGIPETGLTSRPGLPLGPQAPQPATQLPAKVHPGRVSGTGLRPKCHHIAPRSTKNHSLGANIPRNSSQDAPATPPKHRKSTENLQKPTFFPLFLLSRPYATLTPKSCKKTPNVAQVGHPRVKCDPC